MCGAAWLSHGAASDVISLSDYDRKVLFSRQLVMTGKFESYAACILDSVVADNCIFPLFTS
jgi:hypothetical protein